MYEVIKEELASGGRAYIVCPLIAEGVSDFTADLKVCLYLAAPPQVVVVPCLTSSRCACSLHCRVKVLLI